MSIPKTGQLSGVIPRQRNASYRLNGIPPLDHVPVLPAARAGYLRDSHVVFGIVIGGEARTFGTSGLLYRLHKLMFDRESMSLWSTFEVR